MGRLIAVEGLDGAGKRTLIGELVNELERRGQRVSRWAFPRYEDNVHAHLVHEALHGQLGDLIDSVHGMALLNALDRRDATETLVEELDSFDVVLADRYLASNAAYGAARMKQHSDGEFVTWLRELEVSKFGIPVPDVHLLLRVSPELAARRARDRERNEHGRQRDLYESNEELQDRCGRVYAELAESQWLSPWLVIDGAAERTTPVSFSKIVDEIYSVMMECHNLH